MSIGEAGLLPAPQVRIPPMSTVVFRNRTGGQFGVDIAGAACQRCDTVMGFTPGERGATCENGAPHGVATLCFHEPGTFPFVVTIGGHRFDGVIEVVQ